MVSKAENCDRKPKGDIVLRIKFTAWTVVGISVFGLIACGGVQQPADKVSEEKMPITTASEEARTAYLEGRQLLENLRFTDANQFFLQAVVADPGFAMAHLGVANTSSTAQEFFAALRRAVETADGCSDGEKMQIRAFEAGVNGEPNVQRSQLEALVAAYPRDERARNAYAVFLFGQQEDEAAIVEYRSATDIKPDYAPPYNQLGYALRRVGDYAGAEEAFQRYTELIPDQPNPYDSYAELLMKMGRFEESIATYEQALRVDPNFVASYIGISNNRMFMGQMDGARTALAGLEEIARTDGERRQACTWAAVSYLHERDIERALAEVQRRYDIAGETDDRAAMSADLNMMGDILLSSRRAEEAAVKYEASVEIMNTSDATGDVKRATERNHAYDMARMALVRGDVAVASELAVSYRKAVSVHNIRFEVWQSHELGGRLALAQGDPKTALADLRQANQQNPQVLLLEARAHSQSGDKEAARATCEQVVDFNQLSVNLAYVREQARDLLESL
jgi:tetratricopeptide (TPR) repeat protein